MIPGILNPMQFGGGVPMLFVGAIPYASTIDASSHSLALPADRQNSDKAFAFACHAGFNSALPTPSNWTRRWLAGPSSSTAYTARMLCWEYTGGGVPPASVSISTPNVENIEGITLLYRPSGLATVSAPHGTTFPNGPTMIAPTVTAGAGLVYGFDIRAYCSRESGAHQTLSDFDEIVRNLETTGTRKFSVFQKQISAGGSLGTKSVTCDSPSGGYVAGTVVVGVS